MSKVHIRFSFLTPVSICNQNLQGVEQKAFFLADKKSRCERCADLMKKKGYSLEALEKLAKKEVDSYAQLARGA